MLRDAPPIRSVLGEHQAPNDALRLPPELPGDPCREAHLDVERSEQTLQIRNPGLDLDHEQDAADRMEREQIDASTVAVHVEADLDAHEPTIAFEPAFPKLRQRCVVGIEQAIELSAVPTEVESKRNSQRTEDPAQKSEADAVQPTVLDGRDHRIAQIGLGRQVGLPPSEPMPQRANDLTDPHVVHRFIIVMSAYRRLTGAETVT